MHADLILRNAAVHTFNPNQPTAEAIATAGSRILWIGGDSQAPAFKGPGTRILDLAGKAVLPGFIDAHQHQLYMGLSYHQLDLRPDKAGSIEEIITMVQARARQIRPGSWIEGFGFHDGRLEEGRNPNRHDLDRASAEHPVLLSRTCGHVLAINSRALELAGITRDTPDPPGGSIDREGATGEPSGIIRESAMSLVRRVLPRPETAQLREAIRAGSTTNLRKGITSVWEPSIEPDHLRAYQDLEANGELAIRVIMAQKKVLRSGEEVPLPRAFQGEWLSLVAIKLFQDGGFGAATAALTEPYANDPESRGQLIWSQEELNERARQIREAGLGISIHAIGDAAIRSALQAFESAGQPRDKTLQDRIEHCGLPLPPLPEQIAARAVIPVLQPVFLWFDGDVYMDRVGPARARWLYPVRTLLEQGLSVAGSSDGPVVPDINPLLGAYTAATRRSQSGQLVAPEEAVPLSEALRLFTRLAAQACGEGQHRGTLEAGKAADFVILGADPFSVPLPELPGIPVEGVFIGGQEADLRSSI